MAKFLEHPSVVPCPACGNTVNKKLVSSKIKAGSGFLELEGVPQYECNCGSLFVPQETESLIASLQNDKSLQVRGRVNVKYEDVRRKGKKAIKRI